MTLGNDSREANWKETATALRERADRLHRSVLEKDVLRDSLPVRAQTLSSRSAAPEARERERRFHEASPAYAHAVTDDGSLPGMRLITLDGLAWCVPLLQPDDPVRSDRAVQHQDFPYRVIAQTRELAIGGVMLDIGANVGRMSIPRVILGDVIAAYCAEPDPLNYQCLTRNVIANTLRGLVLPDRVAIGGHTGTVRFERSKTAGGHKVVRDDRVTGRETISVPMTTLDEWTARLDIDLDRVSFVKVDVQGSELAVLSGAARVLARRHIAWQLEVDPYLLKGAGASVSDLFALVQRHFTHFIDLNRKATGARVRSASELADALAYVCDGGDGRTDILACTLASPPGASSSQRSG